MPEIEELEAGLIEVLKLRADELPEAKYNLLGFFNVLNKIDQRLKSEKVKSANDGGGRD